MSGNLLRACAEHEAAHAVVAAHFGAPVHEVTATARGDGSTIYDAGRVNRLQQAAITAGADLWNRELGTVPYQDLGCLDLATFEREHGLGPLWQAERVARQILTARRAAVLALADRLVVERTIRFAGLRTTA